MRTRPKIRIELSMLDKLMEGICLLLLVCLWVVVIAGYASLPEEIPIHFNAAGKADGYGNKGKIFLLPAVASFIYLGMTLLNQYPHLFNYPAEINQNNARGMYRSATKLLRVLKFVVVLIFSYIVAITFRSASPQNADLGYWFLIFCIVFTVVPTIMFFFRKDTKAA